jgi:cobyrinic acid a,c-diamide synthase
MTRGIAPLLLGYKLFDPEVEVAGVVLNQVATPRQEEKLRAAVEDYTGLPVFGALGRSPAVIVKERHLGLTTPGDVDGPDARIERIREIVEQGVDIDALIAVAGNARPVRVAAEHVHARIADVRIGVAMDEAFCFYYRDDLETLERAGAEIVPFSPLADPHLPDVDGLFIGGGFPETHVGALAANTSLKAEIAAAAATGMPIHAECGGLMYLSRSIRYEGEAGEMVGVVPGHSVMQSKPQGRGLVVLAENRDGAAPTVPAHEFHFARLEGLPADASFAWRVRRGHGIDGEHDGIVINNVVASFSHFRDTSRCHWARDFVETVRREKRARKTGAAGVTKSGR